MYQTAFDGQQNRRINLYSAGKRKVCQVEEDGFKAAFLTTPHDSNIYTFNLIKAKESCG